MDLKLLLFQFSSTFQYGVERVNRDRSILPNVQLEPVALQVRSGNSYMAEKQVYKILY